LFIFISGAELGHRHFSSNFLNSAFMLSKKSWNLKSHSIFSLIFHNFFHAFSIFFLIQVAALSNISVHFFLAADNHCFDICQYSANCSLVVLFNAFFTSGVALPIKSLTIFIPQGTLIIPSNNAVTQAVAAASHLVGNFHSDNAFIHNISAVDVRVLYKKLPSNQAIPNCPTIFFAKELAHQNSFNCAINLPSQAHFHSGSYCNNELFNICSCID
jgi:hypothetical protein